MTTTFESFSGTHPFKPDCVRAVTEIEAMSFGFSADEVTTVGTHWSTTVLADLKAGRCPRCRTHMDMELAARSRATSCRCIPICSACGADEAVYLTPVWKWPTSKSAVTRRRNKLMQTAKVSTAIVSGDRVITEDGSATLKLRPHPGGWAEFGMDEETS